MRFQSKSYFCIFNDSFKESLWPYFYTGTGINSPPKICMITSCFCLVTTSCPNSFTTAWTAARQAPLSMGLPGKNTAVGCYFLLQGSFQPGIKPVSPAFQADSLPTEPRAQIRKD